MRLDYLEKSPSNILYVEGASSTLNSELRTAVEMLGAKDSLLYLGIDKKRRMYYCPACINDCSRSEYDSGIVQKGVAQLDKSDRNKLHCAACGESRPVERISCDMEDCKGNVQFRQEEELKCLTCLGNPDNLKA